MRKLQKVKNRTYEILEAASYGDIASRIFDIFIMSLIMLNVIAVILGTIESFSSRYSHLLRIFEIISVIIFTVEYVLRIWSCSSNKSYKNPVTGKMKFALTPFAVVDLIAILPFYLPMVFPIDLRFIRALRLIRIFRLFKIGRYSQSLRTLGNVLKAKKEQLTITVFFVVILLVIASSLMYFVEHEAQPETFSSIPAAMWWGVATLTTVGYGDIYPVTPIGKILGAIIAMLGIGMFALPAGILASGFEEVIKKKRQKIICPYCGKEIK